MEMVRNGKSLRAQDGEPNRTEIKVQGCWICVELKERIEC